MSALVYIVFALFAIPGAFALWVDHFNVTLSPSSIKSGEAADLTIEAVDKNDNIVTDYTGSILVFSETDDEADFPTVLKDSSYNFTIGDEWSVTFENAVVFKKSWTQSLSIYDLDDDTIWGEASLEVISVEVNSQSEITILSPDDRITIGWNEVQVSGQTKKNHAVVIKLNNTIVEEINSNTQGIFEATLSDLPNGSHVIQAEILNADKEVIGSSNTTTINVDSSAPIFKSFDIQPGKTDLEPTQEIELIVLANQGLTKVQVILNDTIEDLSPVSDGMYTKVTTAPEEAGSYTIDIVLENELANSITIQAADTIEVKALEAAPVIAVQDDTNPTIEEEEVVEQDPMTIKNLKITELKTKSVLSWDSVEQAESYNVYKVLTDETGTPTQDLELIENVSETQIEIPIVWDEINYEYFAVRAQAQTGTGETQEFYEGDLSAATKIKTGAEIYILILMALLIWGLFTFIKRKA